MCKQMPTTVKVDPYLGSIGNIGKLHILRLARHAPSKVK